MHWPSWLSPKRVVAVSIACEGGCRRWARSDFGFGARLTLSRVRDFGRLATRTQRHGTRWPTSVDLFSLPPDLQSTLTSRKKADGPLRDSAQLLGLQQTRPWPPTHLPCEARLLARRGTAAHRPPRRMRVLDYFEQGWSSCDHTRSGRAGSAELEGGLTGRRWHRAEGRDGEQTRTRPGGGRVDSSGGELNRVADSWPHLSSLEPSSRLVTAQNMCEATMAADGSLSATVLELVGSWAA